MQNRKRIVFLVSALIMLTALLILLVGGSLAGWDLLAWFRGNAAVWAYLLIFMFIFMTAGLLVHEWLGK